MLKFKKNYYTKNFFDDLINVSSSYNQIQIEYD